MADITVTFALTREQALAGTVQVGGVIECRPTARRVIPGVEAILPEPFRVRLVAGEAAPTAVMTQDDGLTWAWQFLERASSGRGQWTTLTLSDVVGTTAMYCDLTEVDPDTLVPIVNAPETVGQRLTALEALLPVDNGDGTITITVEVP